MAPSTAAGAVPSLPESLPCSHPPLLISPIRNGAHSILPLPPLVHLLVFLQDLRSLGRRLKGDNATALVDLFVPEYASGVRPPVP